MEVEHVPRLQLVQVSEEDGVWKAPVSGEHAMGALAPQRVAGLGHVAYALAQDVVVGALVDGQIHVDLGNGDIAHALPQVEEVHIADARVLRLAVLVPLHHAVQLAVILPGGLLGGVQALLVHLLHHGVIVLDDSGGVALSKGVAKEGIADDAQSG